MAFDVERYGGYGTGALGSVTDPAGQINSYANVTAYTTSSVTIGTPSNGIYEKFDNGVEIMLHISASNGTATDTSYLGRYMTCKIINKKASAAGFVLGVDKDFTQIIPLTEAPKYSIQAITIANFNYLTLTAAGHPAPPAYSITSKFGGIIVIKCKNTFTLNGGRIALENAGIPNDAWRPIMSQEQYGQRDYDKYAGWENGLTADCFVLNRGDGAAMIFANDFVNSSSASRIGGTAAGRQFVRNGITTSNFNGNTGADANSVLGASTILCAFGTIKGFDSAIISKNRGNGKGLGRCYIASNTKLVNDEGLYAYDTIFDPSRAMDTLNIRDYGDASLGKVNNPTAPLNNYAKVTGVSDNGKIIAYVNKTTDGLAPLKENSLVMFHVSKHTDDGDMSLLGRLMITKIVSDDGKNITLKDSVSNIFPSAKIAKYSCQLISIAQFSTLTVSADYTATRKWDDTNKIGGICAIAATESIDLSNGKINLYDKGGGNAYGINGLNFIGNAQDNDTLPLGQGNGSFFCLTRKLIVNKTSRIGGSQSGTELGGLNSKNRNNTAGGYFPVNNSTPNVIDGYVMGASGNIKHGHCVDNHNYDTYYGRQGAHIMIVADVISGFNLNFISTGGTTGYAGGEGLGDSNNPAYGGTDAGAGYGGGGGSCWWNNNGGTGGGYKNGGFVAGDCSNSSGGASGWAFIHCNIYEDVDTTGIIV